MSDHSSADSPEIIHMCLTCRQPVCLEPEIGGICPLVQRVKAKERKLARKKARAKERLKEMNKTIYECYGTGEALGPPYFPDCWTVPACGACDYQKECPNCGKFQRGRRDFSITSGRCPRLPDLRGQVAEEFRESYLNTFALVPVQMDGETLQPLYILIPGVKRGRVRLYHHQAHWRFRSGQDEAGQYVYRQVELEHYFTDETEIREYMKRNHFKELLLRAEIGEEVYG